MKKFTTKEWEYEFIDDYKILVTAYILKDWKRIIRQRKWVNQNIWKYNEKQNKHILVPRYDTCIVNKDRILTSNFDLWNTTELKNQQSIRTSLSD